jgi:hypothetical protein
MRQMALLASLRLQNLRQPLLAFISLAAPFANGSRFLWSGAFRAVLFAEICTAAVIDCYDRFVAP